MCLAQLSVVRHETRGDELHGASIYDTQEKSTPGRKGVSLQPPSPQSSENSFTIVSWGALANPGSYGLPHQKATSRSDTQSRSFIGRARYGPARKDFVGALSRQHGLFQCSEESLGTARDASESVGKHVDTQVLASKLWSKAQPGWIRDAQLCQLFSRQQEHQPTPTALCRPLPLPYPLNHLASGTVRNASYPTSLIATLSLVDHRALGI